MKQTHLNYTRIEGVNEDIRALTSEAFEHWEDVLTSLGPPQWLRSADRYVTQKQTPTNICFEGGAGGAQTKTNGCSGVRKQEASCIVTRNTLITRVCIPLLRSRLQLLSCGTLERCFLNRHANASQHPFNNATQKELNMQEGLATKSARGISDP